MSGAAVARGGSQHRGLSVEGLRVRHRHGPEVIFGVDFDARPGEVLGLIGPNGAGKSTLLKAVLGLLPSTGRVMLDGLDLGELSARERAQRVAYVPQRTALTAPLPVRSVVDLGRFAHRAPRLAPWARPPTEERAIVEEAMADTDVVHLADRLFSTLSAGEQQRVLLARALASQAPVLLLDEPTSALDVRQVLFLHAIVRELADRGRVVVVVLHDLAEVRERADRVLLLQHGRVHRLGATGDVVAPGPVRSVYRVDLVEHAGLAYRLPDEAGDDAHVSEASVGEEGAT